MDVARYSCRDLVLSARFGALATLARDPPGWPFATLVAVAFDHRGRPLFLLSSLAEHTKNLEGCSHASLLVSATARGASADPLTLARMTLVGECARVTSGTEPDQARARFLEAHSGAAMYAAFGDFSMWRLEVAGVRWVGGFGRMEWMSGEDYAHAFATGATT
jgi:putative heme iron utilization protein